MCFPISVTAKVTASHSHLEGKQKQNTVPFGHCNSETFVSLTWECHQGKLNVSVPGLHREGKQQVAQRAAQPACRLQKPGTLEFASEYRTDVSCDFAPLLPHLRTGEQGDGEGACTGGAQWQREARRRSLLPWEQFFLYASNHFSFDHHSPFLWCKILVPWQAEPLHRELGQQLWVGQE